MYACSLLVFLAVGCGPIPIKLLTHLQAKYAAIPKIIWGKRNAIVLLGGGTSRLPALGSAEINPVVYSRMIKAFALYNTCKQHSRDCKIIISGGDAQHHGVSEAVVYGSYLKELGVQSTDLILESRSMNTWQNAEFVAPILRQYAADQVLLVSSGIHIHRSNLYFLHFGIQTIPIRSDYLSTHISLLPTAYNFALADFALHEYLGILRYHAYNALGWNVSAKQPDSV